MKLSIICYILAISLNLLNVQARSMSKRGLLDGLVKANTDNGINVSLLPSSGGGDATKPASDTSSSSGGPLNGLVKADTDNGINVSLLPSSGGDDATKDASDTSSSSGLMPALSDAAKNTMNSITNTDAVSGVAGQATDVVSGVAGQATDAVSDVAGIFGGSGASSDASSFSSPSGSPGSSSASDAQEGSNGEQFEKMEKFEYSEDNPAVVDMSDLCKNETEEGFHHLPSNCKMFYRCVNNTEGYALMQKMGISTSQMPMTTIMYNQPCPPGLMFSTGKETCMPYEHFEKQKNLMAKIFSGSAYTSAMQNLVARDPSMKCNKKPKAAAM